MKVTTGVWLRRQYEVTPGRSLPDPPFGFRCHEMGMTTAGAPISGKFLHLGCFSSLPGKGVSVPERDVLKRQ